MKNIFTIIFVFSILTGCALTNNGTWDFDLIVDVDIAKDIIRASVGIGLPLALERIDQEERSKHSFAVATAASTILAVLKDDATQLDSDAVNGLLAKLDDKLATSERHAIQSAMNLILSLVIRKASAYEHISPDVREILVFFVSEVKQVYDLYSKPSKKRLGTAPLRFEQ